MKKGNKVALGLLALLGLTGGFLYVKNKKANQVDPGLPEAEIIPSGNTTTKTSTPAVTLNYNSKFTKADKAHVSIMQKLIGVPADGVWGPKTEAALPVGLIRPFTLNELQQVLNAISSNAKWSATSLDEKIKVRLSYAMSNLFSAKDKTKQVVSSRGSVSTVPDWDYKMKVFNENVATMKANGISLDQLVIQYYNLYKRNLKLDYKKPGVGSLGNVNLL